MSQERLNRIKKTIEQLSDIGVPDSALDPVRDYADDLACELFADKVSPIIDEALSRLPINERERRLERFVQTVHGICERRRLDKEAEATR